MEKWNELQLLIAKGDQEALQKFYELTKHDVWFLCFEILKDEQDAWNVMQKIYLTVCQEMTSWDDPEQFLPALRKTAAMECGKLILERNVTAIENNDGNTKTDAPGKSDKKKSKKKSSGKTDNNSASDQDNEASSPKPTETPSDQNADGITGKESDSTAADVPDTLPEHPENLIAADAYLRNDNKNRAFLQMMDRSLSLVQYQTVILYYYGGLSEQELAGYYRCSDETIRLRLQLSHEKLQTAIEAYETHNHEGEEETTKTALFPEVLTVAAQRCEPPEELPVTVEEDGTIKETAVHIERKKVKKKKNIKLILLIIMLVIMVILAVILAVMVFSRMFGKPDNHNKKHKVQEDVSIGVGVMDLTPEESAMREQSLVSDFNPETINPEKEVTRTTVGVHHVPFDKSYLKNGSSANSDTCTVISFLISSSYVDQLAHFRIAAANQEGSGNHFAFDPYIYEVYQDNNVALSGYLAYIVAEGKHEPSDFSLSFTVEKQEYTLNLSDSVSKVPETMISQQHWKPGNILLIDNQAFFTTGSASPQTQTDYSADTKTYQYTSETTVSWMRVDGDPTKKWDAAQVGYSFPDELKDQYDTSLISVSVSPSDQLLSPFTEAYSVVFSYEYPETASAEEIMPKETVRSVMANTGFLSFNNTPVLHLTA